MTECEIYDCSQGGVRLYETRGAAFTDCDIHDVDGSALSVTECTDIFWNDIILSDGWYELENQIPVSVPAWW